ncbi:hypothetical protein PI87_26625 [Ralstonia sp. A12]|uniref:DUF3592 domain-containing protein n=1 Tax=Ralstonia sp. A12 TaxID=1217052 RepID=UPI0005750766|nr:DUF3592 domain-containing protein [Ralstonia sp. A12]KHK49173.1 hypothetical protein PI87_26625 [Ralstonia sp. A12]
MRSESSKDQSGDDPVTRADKRLVSAISCCLATVLLLWGAERLLYEMVRDNQLAQAEQTWPTVDATIIQSRVVWSEGDPVNWSPVWQYDYTVNNARYIVQSTDLAGGFSQAVFLTRERAEDAANDRPIGEHVMAYYDPSDPSQSVLDRRDPAWNWGEFAAAVLCLVLAVPMGLAGLREFKQYQRLAE